MPLINGPTSDHMNGNDNKPRIRFSIDSIVGHFETSNNNRSSNNNNHNKIESDEEEEKTSFKINSSCPIMDYPSVGSSNFNNYHSPMANIPSHHGIIRYFGTVPSIYPGSLHQYPFGLENEGKYCQLPMSPSLNGLLQGGLFPPCLFRKPKRVRTAFSPNQLLKLEHAFETNQYVVGSERRQLAQALNLTETQVKVWFQNRRTKQKRQGNEDDNVEDAKLEEDDEEQNDKRKPKKIRIEDPC